MSDKGLEVNEESDSGDGAADAIATLLLLGIVVAAVVFWLSGL